jgi:hypothetical protein
MLEAPHHSSVMVGLAAMVRLLKSAHFSENEVRVIISAQMLGTIGCEQT